MSSGGSNLGKLYPINYGLIIRVGIYCVLPGKILRDVERALYVWSNIHIKSLMTLHFTTSKPLLKACCTDMPCNCWGEHWYVVIKQQQHNMLGMTVSLPYLHHCCPTRYLACLWSSHRTALPLISTVSVKHALHVNAHSRDKNHNVYMQYHVL